MPPPATTAKHISLTNALAWKGGTYIKSKLRHRKLHSACLALAFTSLRSPGDLLLLIAHHFASPCTCHITDLDTFTTRSIALANAQSGLQHNYCLLALFGLQNWSVKLFDKTICCETISWVFLFQKDFNCFRLSNQTPDSALDLPFNRTSQLKPFSFLLSFDFSSTFFFYHLFNNNFHHNSI